MLLEALLETVSLGLCAAEAADDAPDDSLAASGVTDYLTGMADHVAFRSAVKPAVSPGRWPPSSCPCLNKSFGNFTALSLGAERKLAGDASNGNVTLHEESFGTRNGLGSSVLSKHRHREVERWEIPASNGSHDIEVLTNEHLDNKSTRNQRCGPQHL